VFPERVALARVAEPATEEALQAIHGAASWCLCREMHGPEHGALGSWVRLPDPIRMAVFNIL
jgi:hypothetical protein